MNATHRLAAGLLTGTLLSGLPSAAPAAAGTTGSAVWTTPAPAPALALATPARTAPAPGAAPAAGRAGTPLPPLQALLDQLVAEGATGVLARVDDGTKVRSYASGTLQRGSGNPETPAARFRVGSVTKSFTSTVVLQLVGEGKLHLSDPVSRWLPGLVPNGRHITVRMLLNHTSGLYDYGRDKRFDAALVADRRHVWAHGTLVRIGTAHAPYFAPGTSWHYSNTNYVVAGLIVEAATGRTLQTEVERRIIGPLKLRQTSLPNFSPFIGGYHTHGYYPPSLTGGLGYIDVTDLSPSATWAAGAVVSTAADLARFHGALFGGKLLRPVQQRELETRVKLKGGVGYGLGIFSLRTPCGTVWGHNGDVPGYVTWSVNDRAGRRSFVLDMSTAPDARTGPLFNAALVVGTCNALGTTPSRSATPFRGATPFRSTVPSLGTVLSGSGGSLRPALPGAAGS